MSTYQAPVDFRTFDSSDMWLACKGFRSVIHRANYTADVEITALLRGTFSSSSTSTKALKTARGLPSPRVLHLLTR